MPGFAVAMKLRGKAAVTKRKKQTIPDDIRAQVEERVAVFNQEVIREPRQFYTVSYRTPYVYVGRSSSGHLSPICRLTYTGNMDDWDFAIYKYSDESYDPDEWFFPGSEHVDGTIEGALKAGVKAYPPMQQANGCSIPALLALVLRNLLSKKS